MESAFKDWDYIEGMIDSAYHEAALKMNLSDSEFSILYIFNEHQEGCNQSAFYKESCMTKSTVNSAIRKMEKRNFFILRQEVAAIHRFFLLKKEKTDGRYGVQSDRDRE